MEPKEDKIQLNKHAQDISRIMAVLSDIAAQPNLLTLNAAIKTARAVSNRRLRLIESGITTHGAY